ncbi:hypothetical protein QLX08_001390 [Tetragonisca angustula]
MKLRNLDGRGNKDVVIVKERTEDRENRAGIELLYLFFSLAKDEDPEESDSCIFSAPSEGNCQPFIVLSEDYYHGLRPFQDRMQDVTGNLISSQRLPLRCDAGYQSENYVCRKQNSLSRERSSAKSAQRDVAEYFPSFSELVPFRAGFS